MQRVQSEKNANISVGELLGHCLEASSVDQVESPCLTLRLSGFGGSQGEEWVVQVRRVSSGGAETGLAVFDLLGHTVGLMRPVSVEGSHQEIGVGKINTEAGSALNGDVGGTIVAELKAACDSIVLGEDGVVQSGGNIRDVIVESHNDGRNIGIVAVC